MEWFVLVIFLNGSAEFWSMGFCKIECLVAIEEIAEQPESPAWVPMIKGRRFAAASCLPRSAVLQLEAVGDQAVKRRLSPMMSIKPKRGPGGCA